MDKLFKTGFVFETEISENFKSKILISKLLLIIRM